MEKNKIYCGSSLEVLKTFPDECVDCVVTSPPYWRLRDYGVAGQMGLEDTLEEYIDNMCTLFDEVQRVLKPEGTCWVNMGDSYSNDTPGSRDKTRWPKQSRNDHRTEKPKTSTPKKCLFQIPARFSIEMTNRGWILRNEIIWHKPTAMPESVKDRMTVDFEKMFFFVKSKKYYFDQESIKEKSKWKATYATPHGWDTGPGGHKTIEHQTKENHRKSQPKGSFNGKTGDRAFRKTGDTRNKRCVWKICARPYAGAHFATFPPDLITPCIKAGCPEGGIVLDPFMGSGTTAITAKKLGRNYAGIELNPEYLSLIEKRIEKENLS